jgi:hypothetical protein
MEKNNEKDKYVMVGTKVSPKFAETFNRICRKKGLNKYQAIQMMVDTFVRYTDDRYNLSEEMSLLMSAFEHMDGWNGAFNLADASADKQIDEAIYFLTAAERNGARAIMVHRPYFGNWTETSNVQMILERVIEVLMPERYRRLRILASDKECNSILELIDRMIDAHTIDQLEQSFRREFEDAGRTDAGKSVGYGRKTKGLHHHTIDGEAARQARLHFDDDDREQADEEAQR